MRENFEKLTLAEVDEKDKVMVVRVSLDLYERLQRESQGLEITVSALVRSLLSFHFFPELADAVLKNARGKLGDQVKQKQQLDESLATYEERLELLEEGFQATMAFLKDEQSRVKNAKGKILEIMEALSQDSEDLRSRSKVIK